MAAISNDPMGARFQRLAPDHQPQADLEATIRRVRDELSAMQLSDSAFKDSHHYMCLNALEGHIREGRLDRNLTWQARLGSRAMTVGVPHSLGYAVTA